MKITRTFACAIICLQLIIVPARAQQAAAHAPVAAPQNAAELRARIAAMLDNPQLAAARIGARVIKTSGEVILERDADKTFTPASNMKLYTTAATLDAYGPAQTFRTSVYAAKADIRAGVLRGDLILYGRGDTNISARFENPDNPGINGELDDYVPVDKITGIETLATQLAARGVKRIAGDLIGDESYFATDGRGWGWEWDDMLFYYGAPISALTVNDNVITFVVTPATKPGAAPVITTKPRTAFMTVTNHATTSAGGGAFIGANRP
ncbi:MAG: D-alanyl-D-alanine carboxypeptidase/D-alanyl-D-alanine-endopeptidase, partial [Blastocatellia bacterium]